MCPFLDESDPRCAAHLSLRRLGEALGLCANQYQNCPIFRKRPAGEGPDQAKAHHAALVAG